MIMTLYTIAFFKNETANNVENTCNSGYGPLLNKNMYRVLGLHDSSIDLVTCYIDILRTTKVLKLSAERSISRRL